MVEAMIDLVAAEAKRIDARFLEPACGDGNFLIPVLTRKLGTVKARYGASDFENRHHALLALMSVYGIELLPDNVIECRQHLLNTFTTYLGAQAEAEWIGAASMVLSLNIVNGDAITMLDSAGQPIRFSEWSYLGKGRFHRRDFRFDTLTQMSAFGEEDTLFADMGKHEIFTPTTDHGLLTVADIAGEAK